MALDVRIFGVLRAVGIMVSPDSIYRQIERELIRKVAKPIGISGAVLDRIPFQKMARSSDNYGDADFVFWHPLNRQSSGVRTKPTDSIVDMNLR